MSSAGHKNPQLNTADIRLPEDTYGKLRTLAVVMAVLGAAGAGFGFATARDSFYFSWLVALVFWVSVGLGGLFFVIVQHLTRAGWGVVVRRVAESLAGGLPVFLVLVVPLIVGMHTLYPWTHTEHLDHVLQVKRPFLNEGFFIVRAVLYVAIWAFLAWRLRRLSVQQDYSGDTSITGRLQHVSPMAVVLFGLSASFAAFDWLMSLDPHWFSTIFGLYFFTGCALAGFASLALATINLRKLPSMHELVSEEHFHDLGKFLFGFTVFWAYIGFSQFFLIWYANIPEETTFYLHRFHGSWAQASAALLFGQFIIQFLILLPRGSKRNPKILGFGALLALAFHYLDLYWLVMPNRDKEGVAPTIADAGAWLFIGGIYLLFVLRQLKAEALVPVKDPRLTESLALENV